MPDLFTPPYPFKRITYPGIDNPLYVGDVRVATEGIMAAAAMLAGVGATSFAIISGLTYVQDTIPYYTPGFFYLNGTFYSMQENFTEGNWLVANVQSSLSEGFNDGNNRTIYNFYGALASPANPDPVNNTLGPQFAGNMNAYRMAIDWMSPAIQSLLATQAALKQAAFRDVGTAAGTVMAGNDPRAPYTAVQLDARYAQLINVITKNAAGGPAGYAPVNPGDPVNKQYSDATSGRRLVSGLAVLGDADSGAGTSHTIALGVTLPANDYTVLFSVISLNANPNWDLCYQVNVRNQTTTSFDLYFREAVGAFQNINVRWIVFAS